MVTFFNANKMPVTISWDGRNVLKPVDMMYLQVKKKKAFALHRAAWLIRCFKQQSVSIANIRGFSEHIR